ncbi:ComEC/Rec2 family competence protein [Changchengzhania lutea]|uniref:ComEC/Rec2 family competence protein n=1 Tax=Changchengzhania lutea TaxID=2049305 RepID=UPI00115E760B|nr:ComEC/Rec2 family competence protein [Changchengzhania lutea]
MKLLNFTIIKLTFCLVIGIVIGHYFSPSIRDVLYSTSSGFIVLFVFYLSAKKRFTKTIWFGIASFLMMINIGVLTTQFHNQKNFSNHYTQYAEQITDSANTITFRIREVLKPGQFYDKHVVDILSINKEKVRGKSLLNVTHDSLNANLKVDAVYVTRSTFKNLINPLNPNQFSYKEYLKKKYIYHQLFIANESLLLLDSQVHTVFGIAHEVREHINKKLEPYHFKPDELAIINALLLGQRQDISKDIYTSYTNAGAIHILAVSGLHVGIILLILSIVLKPIERLKRGKLIKMVLLVSFLWSFALIAGLSGSVTRAVTMFSIVAIAINLKRPTNIFNTLAISMFVILLFKPLFLFDVGFQLSYLAVFAIVTIDPMLYKLWKPKPYIVDKFWHTLTITVSAQFGIIPVALYYFHQFPGLFFISNLVIIPFLGVVLGVGVLVILLAVLNLLPHILADVFGTVIGGMNWFVGWVSKQESFLFKDIAFNLLYVMVSYLIIVSSIKLLKTYNYRNLKILLVAIIIAQIALIYNTHESTSDAFIVFHKSRYSLIGHQKGKTLSIASNSDSLSKMKNNIINDYAVGNDIKDIKEGSLKTVYAVGNKTLLVIDSLGAYKVNSFHPDYVLLRASPKINLNRLIDSIKPKYIIADGSNYKSYVKQWAEICEKRKRPFHQTSKKGAFIITY